MIRHAWALKGAQKDVVWFPWRLHPYIAPKTASETTNRNTLRTWIGIASSATFRIGKFAPQIMTTRRREASDFQEAFEEATEEAVDG